VGSICDQKETILLIEKEKREKEVPFLNESYNLYSMI